MVEVEIRSPVFNEETGSIEWRERVLVRAEGQNIDFWGDRDVVDPAMPVLSKRTGRTIIAVDDCEDWARNLPFAFRSGDVVAAVLVDTNPPELEDVEDAGPAPTIPAPPQPAVFADDTADAV